MEEEKRISIEKALKILEAEGIELSKEDAQILLDFFYIIAEIVVEQHVNDEKFS